MLCIDLFPLGVIAGSFYWYGIALYFIPFNFHYPKAIHQLNALKKIFKNNNYTNSERIAKESISIPIDPNLSKKDIRFIVSVLNSF